MFKIEDEMYVFNKLNTQMTILNKPKFEIGDNVFLKRDVIEYITDDKKTHHPPKLSFGIIVGKEVETISDDYSRDELKYNEEEEQVYLDDLNWIYKIVLRNNLLYKWHNEYEVNNSSFIKCTEGEIELLSELNDFVKEQDFNKIKEIKEDKFHRDEMLATRIGDIQSKFMY